MQFHFFFRALTTSIALQTFVSSSSVSDGSVYPPTKSGSASYDNVALHDRSQKHGLFPRAMKSLKDLSNSSCTNVLGTPGKAAWDAANGNDALDQFTDLWNNNLLYCEPCMGRSPGSCNNTDTSCAMGLRTASANFGKTEKPRFDVALAIYTKHGTNMLCGTNSFQCDDLVCTDTNATSAGYVMMHSVSLLSTWFDKSYIALQQAQANISLDVQQYSKDFAPLPDPKGERLALGLSFAVISGFMGALPLTVGSAGFSLGAIYAGIGSIAGGAANNIFANSVDSTPADTNSVLETITSNITSAMVNVSTALFANGILSVGSNVTNLTDLMRDGNLMNLKNLDNNESGLQQSYMQLLYQQLTTSTWQYLQKDGETHEPFITFAPGKCSDLDYTDDKKVPFANMGLENTDSHIDYNGSCYWLLDAISGDLSGLLGQPGFDACGFGALPGGTNKGFADNKDWMPVNLTNFIVPSVEGWLQNNQLNGFPISGAAEVVAVDPLSAGTTNISVCDWLSSNQKNLLPGKGCPLIFHGLINKQCLKQEPNSPPNNAIPITPGVWAPGTCKIQFVQYEIKAGVWDLDLNPDPNGYQLSIVVNDADQRVIGNAAKAWVGYLWNVQNTALPYSIYVYVDPDANKPISIWYADQYLTTDDKSALHDCTMEQDWYEGTRKMWCVFSCPMPPNPGPAATIANPMPSGVQTQEVIPFGDPETQSFTYREGPTPGPRPVGDYPGGGDNDYCWVAITQYQNYTQGVFFYQYEAYVGTKSTGRSFADNANGQVTALPNVPMPIYGLRDTFNVTFDGDDGAPMKFSYYNSKGGYLDEWDSKEYDGHQCQQGDWGDTHRRVVCNFKCA